MKVINNTNSNIEFQNIVIKPKEIKRLNRMFKREILALGLTEIKEIEQVEIKTKNEIKVNDNGNATILKERNNKGSNKRNRNIVKSDSR